MTSPRKSLLISYVIFGVAIALFIASAIIGAVQAKPALEALQQAQKTELSDEPIVQPVAQEGVENEPQQASEAVDPVSTPTAPADTTAPVKEQGAHIPFTQAPVTPGDPESYVDTVGQCPFYEMGGPKGCVPPADIECNADWSECHPREQ